MSLIYLIRHGQAGTREDYDQLSEVGQEQARLVGRYFAEQEIKLDAIYSGSLKRQRQTADLASAAYRSARGSGPDVVTDERLDEFSLASVYRAISRRMMEESEDFARDFAEMQEALRADPHTTRGATGRCDAAVIQAWIENRYSDFKGESWTAFRDRIRGCVAVLSTAESKHGVAVFTSATPIAILTGAALDLSNEKLLAILGVIYNTSMSVIRIKAGQLRLFTFNATPHLHSSPVTLR